MSKHVLKAVLVVFLLALVFAFFGVYQTHEMPPLTRYAFWVLTIGVGALSSAVTAPFVLNGPTRSWPGPVQFCLIAAIVSVPVTIVIQVFEIVGSGRGHPVFVWGIQYLYVLTVSLVITGLTFLLDRANIGLRPKDETIEDTDPVRDFISRLPIRYRGAALYAVSSEDHYLRVHTDRGEELILMRLADAVRELSRANGLQTHRSWWVAADGVSDARRDGGKLMLILKSGVEVPVSRSFAKAVRETGLA